MSLESLERAHIEDVTRPFPFEARLDLWVTYNESGIGPEFDGRLKEWKRLLLTLEPDVAAEHIKSRSNSKLTKPNAQSLNSRRIRISRGRGRPKKGRT